MLKNIWFWISVFLAVTAVGVIVLSVFNYTELNKYKEIYELNDQDLICSLHEETIERLQSELTLTEEKLKVSQANEIEKVLKDNKYFLETFYTVDDSHKGAERYEKLKDYVTGDYVDYISYLTPVTTEYVGFIHIQETFYTELTDSQAKTLIFATTGFVNERWGNVSSANAYYIYSKYNKDLDIWQVADVKVGEGIDFAYFKSQ